MTPAERAQILVTARLLEAAGKIDALSTGLTLIAAAAVFFGARSACIVIALGVLAKVYSVRIAFDAQLLNDIALDQLTEADLDAAFPSKAGRAWNDRLRGAKRLVIICGIATVAQCIAVIAMALRTLWT